MCFWSFGSVDGKSFVVNYFSYLRPSKEQLDNLELLFWTDALLLFPPLRRFLKNYRKFSCRLQQMFLRLWSVLVLCKPSKRCLLRRHLDRNLIRLQSKEQYHCEIQRSFIKQLSFGTQQWYFIALRDIELGTMNELTLQLTN